MGKGLLITFEGTDGSGKSTHVKWLAKWLRQNRRSVVVTREPGGGKISERIRKLILDPKNPMNPLTELFLYEAARAEHASRVIIPALKSGAVVVCDRFTDSTLAYQGYARGLSLKTISILNKIAAQGVVPHMTIFLDLPADQGLKNAKNRKGGARGDRMENEGVQFQRKVRNGYRKLARTFSRRVFRVRIQPSVASTQKLIRALIQKRLKP